MILVGITTGKNKLFYRFDLKKNYNVLKFLEYGGRFTWRLKKNDKSHANQLKKAITENIIVV